MLTFQDTRNFGACLQAIALQRKVSELGYDIEIINYHNDRIYKNEVECVKFPFNSIKNILRWILFIRKENNKLHVLQNEMKQYSKLSNIQYRKDSIKNSNGNYDTFLVGSDQVWALNLTDHDYTYYLDFVEKSKIKLSFASSISDEKSFSEDKIAQSLLKEFSQISVREEDAKNIIKTTIDRDVAWVCDPTMLFDSNEWDKLVSPVEYKGKYVFVYFTDPKNKIFEDALRYARENDCEVLFCNSGRKKKDIKNVHPKSLSEWIGLIKHAQAIFTASYHGMLFSLYYNRPLIFYNRNQKSRMYSLSKLMKIEDNNGELFSEKIIPEINYKEVNSVMTEFREYSIDVLKRTLEDAIKQ